MSEESYKTDVVIVGAGVIGLCVARELIRKRDCRLLLIEKESTVAMHASGRNSGVLHAGIYYPESSLKAQFCLSGNHAWREFCRDKNLSIRETGKWIVAKTETELSQLMRLYERAKSNGAIVHLKDPAALKKAEPLADTHKMALFCEDTAVIEPKSVMNALLSELEETQRCEVLFESGKIKKVTDQLIHTSRGKIHYDLLINCAGSQAVEIALDLGVDTPYRLIPFKGAYKKLSQKLAAKISSHVYPVPDLRMPFLGVHVTKAVNGDVYLGPTACPAFGKEAYTTRFPRDREGLSLLAQSATMFVSNPAFRLTALRELIRLSDYGFYREAKSLIPSLQMSDLETTHKVGIRPQLVNWRTKTLEMDFKVVTHGRTVHVLNAVSPAFTAAIPFAKKIVDITENINV